jgi:proteasome assembly chaperone (PAC2) family protein
MKWADPLLLRKKMINVLEVSMNNIEDRAEKLEEISKLVLEEQDVKVDWIQNAQDMTVHQALVGAVIKFGFPTGNSLTRFP